MMLKRKNGGYFVIIDVRQQRFGHIRCKFYIQYCQRPYHVELTRSRQLTDVFSTAPKIQTNFRIIFLSFF